MVSETAPKKAVNLKPDGCLHGWPRIKGVIPYHKTKTTGVTCGAERQGSNCDIGVCPPGRKPSEIVISSTSVSELLLTDP